MTKAGGCVGAGGAGGGPIDCEPPGCGDVTCPEKQTNKSFINISKTKEYFN